MKYNIRFPFALVAKKIMLSEGIKFVRYVIFFITMYVTFGVGPAMAQQPAPVKVEDGLLQGVFEDGLTVYKGIPFAAPPVGDLRWRAPQAAAKWEGVRQATKFGPSPIQGSGSGH